MKFSLVWFVKNIIDTYVNRVKLLRIAFLLETDLGESKYKTNISKDRNQ